MFKVATTPPGRRVYEDFDEGQQMPVVAKGPMSAGHQVRWAGACDNYASEFHHDAQVAREQGLPGLLLSGPFMASFMLTEVTRWLGGAARVVSFWNRNSAPTMPGDLARIEATVKRRWREGDDGYVEIDCRIVNQDGKPTTPGGLVARLPLRGGGRVMTDVAAMEAYLKTMHGPLGEPDSMPIELMSVRRMALAIEALDPIHFDEAAARERGFRGVVAPWPLLWLAFFNCRDAPLHFPFGKATIHGGDSYEFHEPMIVGDVVTVSAAVVETSVKQGKAGPMAAIVTRREYRNQDGALCAVMSTTNLRR